MAQDLGPDNQALHLMSAYSLHLFFPNIGFSMHLWLPNIGFSTIGDMVFTIGEIEHYPFN